MKTYSAPALADLGDVRSMTAAFGNPTQSDQIFINGVPQDGDTQGSQDLCNTPNGEACADG